MIRWKKSGGLGCLLVGEGFLGWGELIDRIADEQPLIPLVTGVTWVPGLGEGGVWALVKPRETSPSVGNVRDDLISWGWWWVAS